MDVLFIEIDSMMVLATSITTATRMLSALTCVCVCVCVCADQDSKETIDYKHVYTCTEYCTELATVVSHRQNELVHV